MKIIHPSPKVGSLCDNCLRKFIINFRRGNDYAFDGGFGFDWFRNEYENPMIEYKIGNEDSFKASMDKTKISSGVEGSISALKKTFTDGQPSTINPFGVEYIPAWICLPVSSDSYFRRFSLNLELIPIGDEEQRLDIVDDGTQLIFESSNPNISIEPSTLKLGDFTYSQKNRIVNKVNHKEEIYYELEAYFQIECKEKISSHEEINVYAIKGDAKEKVGKLMVYNNAQKPILKFTFVHFIIDDTNLEVTNDYLDFLNNNSFNQAMIDVQVVKTLTLDMRKYRQPNNVVDRVLKDFERGDFSNSKAFIHHALEKYFDKDYKNKRYVVLFNKDHSSTAGATSGKMVLLFKGAEKKFNTTLVHELGHALSLPHIFKENNLSTSKVSKHNNNQFTFIERSTTNFMDYSGYLIEIAGTHRVAVFPCRTTNYFFKYQWDIMRKKLGA